MMPYSCDPLSRDLDGKSITTEFLFPYLRYFEFMCAKRLRGRLYFVIRLSKIQIKVAHANFFIYLYRYWLLDLVLSYPSKMVILREKKTYQESLGRAAVTGLGRKSHCLWTFEQLHFPN